MEFPIAKYSARYWLSHFWKAHSILEERHYKHALELFFDKRKLHNWVALYDIGYFGGYTQYLPHGSQGSSLYYAVLTGFYSLVEVILQSGRDMYEKEETPIGRHSATAALDHGWAPSSQTGEPIHINRIGGSLHDPLQAASWSGWPDIVELLLTHGAKPNIYRRVAGWFYFFATMLEGLRYRLLRGTAV